MSCRRFGSQKESGGSVGLSVVGTIRSSCSPFLPPETFPLFLKGFHLQFFSPRLSRTPWVPLCYPGSLGSLGQDPKLSPHTPERPHRHSCAQMFSCTEWGLQGIPLENLTGKSPKHASQPSPPQNLYRTTLSIFTHAQQSLLLEVQPE